jgi:hypothetical protein
MVAPGTKKFWQAQNDVNKLRKKGDTIPLKWIGREIN